MESVGRLLMIAGIVIFVIGGSILLASRLGLRLGHLPGDVRIEGKNSVFYFPLATSILLSIVLTLLLNLIARLLKH